MEDNLDDEIYFASEDSSVDKEDTNDIVNILVVDDDEDIHSITKMALYNKKIDGRKLNILKALSAKEAKVILNQYDDIALAIVDVIMETSEAGLDLVNYIRNELHNNTIRLVLRTGQSAQEVEEAIIDNYDINDYKDKTELTTQKLYTTVRTSIKQYELISNLQNKIDAITKELDEKNKLVVKHSRIAAMGDIINMLAHQWRQPLSIINMNINEILLNIEMGTMDESSLINDLKNTENEIFKLSDTIGSFQDYFKTDAVAGLYDINELIDITCSLLDSSINNNSIKIEKKYEKNMFIKIKKNDFIQVVLNLITNSTEAYQKGEFKYKNIIISTTKTDKHIDIKLTDFAGGISNDIIENIFDPYFSTKNEKNGTGLGLYMSKTIVESYFNGSINVSSKDNSTIFTITLPINQ